MNKIFNHFVHGRAVWNADVVAPYLKSQDHALDFGCGDMSIALELSKRLSLNVTGTDVLDYRLPEAKMFDFVSYKLPLPFPDGTFDVVLAVFVLHHIEEGEHALILKELARVSKRSLVIVEDVYSTHFERTLLCINDWIGNRLESSEIPIPYAFRTEEEWKEFFMQEIHPSHVETKKFRARYGLWKSPHALFHIKK